MSDYSDAFSALKDAVQPDVDPVLTYGDGETPDTEKDLDRILERHKTAAWGAEAVVRYGERRVPVTGNGHVYRAAQGGTTAATEPSWPTSDYSQASDGTVVWEEAGAFSGSVYAVRAAIYEALNLKLTKAANDVQFLNDARAQASSYLFLNLQRLRDRYRPVGVA